MTVGAKCPTKEIELILMTDRKDQVVYLFYMCRYKFLFVCFRYVDP